MGAPLFMALLIFVVGLALMVVSRMTFAQAYFRKDAWESVDDDVARAALGPAGPGA